MKASGRSKLSSISEKKGAEATPSEWRPGKETLKPGPNLVGNVWKKWKTEMAFD